MGNHDKTVAYNVDCRCGERTRELSVYTRNKISLKLLKQEHIKIPEGFTQEKIFDIEGYTIYAVHASPLNPLYGYEYPNTPEDKFKELVLYEINQLGVKKKSKLTSSQSAILTFNSKKVFLVNRMSILNRLYLSNSDPL